MKVIYHIGVHCTDEQKLVTCLRANADLLARQSIIVPDPKVYRPMLREVMKAMKGAPSSKETEETILDAVMVQDHADRLIFSNDMILTMRPRAIGRGKFYPPAGERVASLVNLLPSHEAEIFLAIRNPATFIPAIFAAARNTSYDELMEGTSPRDLSWADMVERMRAAHPTVPITVWCDEDTPLIWPEVLQAVSAHSSLTRLEGADDLLASIMSEEGMARMNAYFRTHPPVNTMHRRRVTIAFLDKYAIDDEIEMELDLPGWDEALVEDLTGRYEEDVVAISRMPGVTLIAP